MLVTFGSALKNALSLLVSELFSVQSSENSMAVRKKNKKQKKDKKSYCHPNGTIWLLMSHLTCGNVMTYLWENIYISLPWIFIDILYLKNALRYSSSDFTIGLAMPKNIYFDSSITSLALSNRELWQNVIFRHFGFWRPSWICAGKYFA